MSVAINEIISAHLRYLRLRGLAETYIYNRSRALARMIAALPVPLLDASPAELLAWRGTLDRLTPDATVAYLTHAREFYRWAVEAGHLAVNPALLLPSPKRAKRLPRPVAEPDALAAVELASQPVRCWLVLAGWCGLRAREIAYLQRDNVQVAEPARLLVDAAAAKGRTERIVPLARFVVEELQRYGLPATGYVFRRADGQPGPNMPWRVSQRCNTYLQDDLGLAVTLHQWRHRFGTQAYAVSRDLRAVQELMGHAHTSTTALYVAYAAGSAAAAVDGLPVPGH